MRGRLLLMKAYVIKRMAVVLSATAGLSLVAFAAAGTFAWTRGWALLTLNLALLALGFVLMSHFNPGLLEARSAKHAGVKPFDRVISGIYSALVFAVPVVAGLDAVRFRWSALPVGSLYAGIALYLLGGALISGAVVSNPWLETQVRIQEDRGHRVAAGGPYRFVRHPMYAGIVAQYLGIPSVLGSAWACVPAFLIVALLVVRTVLEERTLRAELPGYEEYTQRTRYRLAPLVW